MHNPPETRTIDGRKYDLVRQGISKETAYSLKKKIAIQDSCAYIRTAKYENGYAVYKHLQDSPRKTSYIKIDLKSFISLIYDLNRVYALTKTSLFDNSIKIEKSQLSQHSTNLSKNTYRLIDTISMFNAPHNFRSRLTLHSRGKKYLYDDIFPKRIPTPISLDKSLLHELMYYITKEEYEHISEEKIESAQKELENLIKLFGKI